MRFVDAIVTSKGRTGRKKGRGRTVALALALVLPVGPVALLCQAPLAIPSISVDVNLVVLPATVRDREGGFVSGLTKEDFQVFENGRAQEIRLFHGEDVPVSVGLLVDNSASMGAKRKDVAAAAVAFAGSSNPLDEMFVIDFNEKVTLGLPSTELFSASPSELEAALKGVPARGRTALYDAIEAGLAHLKKATRDKKVLILISDGGDNSSRHTLKEVRQDSARSNVIIYAIGLLDEHDADQNPGFLNRIARITGGEAFFPTESRDVVTICRRIAAEIRHQYTIGYSPANAKLDSTYRSIKITARAPNRGHLFVRTRAGYIASPGGASRPADTRGQERVR